MTKNTEERCVRFTKREIDVLTLTLQGKTAEQTGDSLHLSRRTVESHLRHIYKKLQVSNSIEAIRCAVTLGLIDLKKFQVTT